MPKIKRAETKMSFILSEICNIRFRCSSYCCGLALVVTIVHFWCFEFFFSSVFFLFSLLSFISFLIFFPLTIVLFLCALCNIFNVSGTIVAACFPQIYCRIVFPMEGKSKKKKIGNTWNEGDIRLHIHCCHQHTMATRAETRTKVATYKSQLDGCERS